MKLLDKLFNKNNELQSDIERLNIPSINHKYPKYKTNNLHDFWEDEFYWDMYDIDPDMGDH